MKTGEKIENKNLSEEMCRLLKGKKLFLYGRDGNTKKLTEECLNNINVHNDLKMVIEGRDFGEGSAEQKALLKGSLVILFGEMSGMGSESLKQLDQCMTEMENIGRAEPEAVVYISDSRVYGKSFGPQKSLCEQELGYVCHTAMKEMDRQCMRTAEHLVCRMAKEQNIPVKVIRLNQHPEAEELCAVMPYILGVLVKGISGEIYNAGGVSDENVLDRETAGYGKELQKQNSLSWTEDRSPLTAMKIEMNTEKVRNYVASELFE